MAHELEQALERFTKQKEEEAAAARWGAGADPATTAWDKARAEVDAEHAARRGPAAETREQRQRRRRKERLDRGLSELMRLAGQPAVENYEEKLSEYENAPEEEYFDVEDQLIGLAGGLNGPKAMYPTVAGGDNPMAVIPVKVDEADMFEKIYQNYRSFVDEKAPLK